MKEYKATFNLNASVESCWDAWTKDDVIAQWLGIVSKGSNSDDFCLSCAMPYLSGRHQLISSEHHKFLKFTWYIQGCPSELSIKFEPTKSGTKLSIDHTLTIESASKSLDPLHRADQKCYYLGQWWSSYLPKLRCLLEDNEQGVLISEANNGHHIDLQVDIKSSSKKIYDALLDVKQLLKWCDGLCMEGTKVVPEVGGYYSYGWYPEGTDHKDMKDGPSKVLALEHNSLLTINWHGGQQIAEVSWKLEDLGDGTTRVHFTHSPLLGHTTGNVWSYRYGWAETLYALKWFIERGEVPEDWQHQAKT